jgi:spermidine/putrescine transport system substrate-binding protein
MKKIIFLLLLIFNLSVFADDNILNVYNWSNYMPDDVIAQFEKETGIHINYSTYDGNDTLYAKLKADPNAGYDVIVPSSSFVDRMKKQNMLEKLDKSQLSNFKNMNPSLLGKAFDPNNDYSIPYLWGSTGIVVNKNYFDPSKITRWSDLWKPEFQDKLLFHDEPHDVFSVALMVLGYPASDANPDHVYQAYLKLKELLPNIKLFNTDVAKVNYLDEDTIIGMGYSGDTYQAWKENPNLVYIYPEDGFVTWIDCLAIPKNAPHLNNAYKFLNFLMRSDIAAKISIELAYASPNRAALQYMPASMRNNPIIYPDAKTLARAQFETEPGTVNQLYEKYMEELKVSA